MTNTLFTNLLTKKQVLGVYAFANITADKLPKRFGQVSVFPSPLDPKTHFEVRKTVFNATYGGKLFEVKHIVEVL
jgi:hypothetical protein